MINHDLAIMVCSNDKYTDLWYPFFKLFTKYWPNNKLNIYLNTESEKYSYPKLNINQVLLNDDEKKYYGKRMRKYIESIDEEYILILLDDFFIRKEVQIQMIENILKWMKEDENIACFNFDASKSNTYSKKYAPFRKVNKYAPYKLNMQAGIWRKNVLLEFWHDDDNPWTWEIFTNYETINSNYTFYNLDDWENSPIYYGYKPEGMGVYRGKWVLNDVESLFLENGILIDYNIRGTYEKSKKRHSLKSVLVYLSWIKKRSNYHMVLSYIKYKLLQIMFRILGNKDFPSNHLDYLQNKLEKGDKNV
jgi:hypothetical protein